MREHTRARNDCSRKCLRVSSAHSTDNVLCCVVLFLCVFVFHFLCVVAVCVRSFSSRHMYICSLHHGSDAGLRRYCQRRLFSVLSACRLSVLSPRGSGCGQVQPVVVPGSAQRQVL